MTQSSKTKPKWDRQKVAALPIKIVLDLHFLRPLGFENSSPYGLNAYSCSFFQDRPTAVRLATMRQHAKKDPSLHKKTDKAVARCEIKKLNDLANAKGIHGLHDGSAEPMSDSEKCFVLEALHFLGYPTAKIERHTQLLPVTVQERAVAKALKQVMIK